jgi:uncharacterized protein YndB with AHSA1/START domain
MPSERVSETTGRTWDEWFELLDRAGAAELSHKEIVGHLTREHPEVSPWWRQTITVEYERARGKRVLGQTADAGFQVGVRRTIDAALDEAWELVTENPELWLGDDPRITFEKGARYARGEVRVVKPGDRIRMTWQPDGWEAPATLQVTFLESKPGRTSIGFHLEKLPDSAAREEMRERFRTALDRLASASVKTS